MVADLGRSRNPHNKKIQWWVGVTCIAVWCLVLVFVKVEERATLYTRTHASKPSERARGREGESRTHARTVARMQGGKQARAGRAERQGQQQSGAPSGELLQKHRQQKATTVCLIELSIM